MSGPVPHVAINAVRAALALLPPAMASNEALAMLYGTGMQESRFEFRRQLGNGPARGFWQFEKGGGVKGVCTHDASRFWMSKICQARDVPFTIESVYQALEFDDVLAAGAARLLYFTDPRPLPIVGDIEGTWNLYARTWRPGKPHRATWPEMYGHGIIAMREGLA